MAEVRRIGASAAVCGVGAIAVIAAAAVVIAVGGLAGVARDVLGFGFGGARRSPTVAAVIALHNGRLAAGTVVCAILVPQLRCRARGVVTGLLAALLAFNAAAIGVAVGAYGTRVLAATRMHLPLELGGLCLAGGTYVQACRKPLRVSALAIVATGCAVLLGGAALLETYVPIEGTP